VNKYIVSVPLTGAIHVEVEAASAKEAEERAWDKINEHGEKAGEVEWEFHEKVTEGNICHAFLDEIEVSRVKP
jgi:hypothetical protein